MPIRIERLLRDGGFKKFSSEVKLLFIYLCTHRSVTILGTLEIDPEVVALNLGFSLEDTRDYTKQLIDHKYVIVKKYEERIFFIIPKHFETVAMGEATILKMARQRELLPQGLRVYLDSIGIEDNAKIRELVKPTVDEINRKAVGLGYIVDGQAFYDYYEGQMKKWGKKYWVDGRRKQVRDWAQKLRTVWCKPENKMRKVEGAPKGFEDFVVLFEGKYAQPDSWRGGKPASKNLPLDIELKKEYKNIMDDK